MIKQLARYLALGLFCVAMATAIVLVAQRERPPEISVEGARVGEVAALPPGEAVSNRLLVVGARGEVRTMAPDGGGVVTVATPSKTLGIQQPTWSPDARHLAWAELGQKGVSSLVLSDAAGQNPLRVPTPFPPFYLAWRPDGQALAYLSGAAIRDAKGDILSSLGLFYVEPGGSRPVLLGNGEPFYFAWSPDGRQVLVHTEMQHVGITTVADAGHRTAVGAPGMFAAPVWCPSQNRLLFVVKDGEKQALALIRPEASDGGPERELLHFGNENATFVANPVSDHVACVLTPHDSPLPAFGPLLVCDFSGEKPVNVPIDDGPVIASSWSPDGSKLLYLVAETQAQQRVQPALYLPTQGLMARAKPWVHWCVWDGKQIPTFEHTQLSREFLQQYVKYSDQCAQSMTLWSPDSTAFCFAGSADEHPAGIWVQRLTEPTPQRVADGTFAAWSPR